MKTKQLLVAFLVFTLATFSSAASASNLTIISKQFPKPDKNSLLTAGVRGTNVPLLSFEIGALNDIVLGGATGGGKPTFNEFTIVKRSDEITNTLLQTLMTGGFFDQVILIAGNMEYEFSIVVVTDYVADGTDFEDSFGEVWTMRFVNVKIKRIEEIKSDKNGTKISYADDEFCWDGEFNREC